MMVRAQYVVLAALSFFFTSVPHAEAKLAELLITDAANQKPIELTTGEVLAQIDRTAARVTYDLTFTSRSPKTLEGTFYFALPRQAYVHEFGFWVNGNYQGSAVVEAKAGRVAYESIVRRGIDPALLEWTAGNTFKMRVFPITSTNPTRVKLTIGLPAELPAGETLFKLPLDLGSVDNFKLVVEGEMHGRPEVSGLKNLKLKETNDDNGIQGFKGEFAAKDFLPPEEIKLTAEADSTKKPWIRRENAVDKRFFEAVVFSKLKPKTRPASDSAIIVWDFSFSEKEHHEARIEILRSYLDARQPKKIQILGFGQKPFNIRSSSPYKNADEIVADLTRQPYDGGTRIDLALLALRDAVTAAAKPDVLIFTSGVDSYELFDFNEQTVTAKKLQAFIVSQSIGSNVPLLTKIAKAFGATLIDQDQQLTQDFWKQMVWQLKSVEGSKNLHEIVEPAHNHIGEGTGIFVRGQVKKPGNSELTLTYELAGETQTQKVAFDSDIDTTDSKTVSRLWATGKLAQLIPEKRANQQAILKIALEHQLMSPFTTMVVLEFCEDYDEFNVPRAKDCRSRPSVDIDQGVEENFDVADEESEGGAEEESAEEVSSVAADSAAPADASTMAPESEMAAEPMAAPAPLAKRSDDVEAEAAMTDEGDYDEEVADMGTIQPDTPTRDYGFEKALQQGAKGGVEGLTKAYFAQRQLFPKIPFFYFYAAEQFQKLKQLDLADRVLSNVVEVRPGDARWLRIYAYNLIAWGRAAEALPIYKAISELREEDPQSFRDYGLALMATQNPAAALMQFEKVYTGKWDERLAGMKTVVVHDLITAAKATLKIPRLKGEAKFVAEKYAKLDAGQNAKVIATISWDTDNTDIDLHVVEPSGAHVFYGNKSPNDAAGTLNFDTTQGFGPEQYRAKNPTKGRYRFYLTYFAGDPAAIRDGTLVRADIKVTQNGQTNAFTKTLFLKDREEVRTFFELDFIDKSAPLPPPSYSKVLAEVKRLLAVQKPAEALKKLQTIVGQKDPKNDGVVHFHIARAHLRLRQFELAEQHNQRALALNPKLLSAHFNNACAGALANNQRKALHHLNLLADALKSWPKSKRDYYADLMRKDADLISVRKTKEFANVIDRVVIGH